MADRRPVKSVDKALNLLVRLNTHGAQNAAELTRALKYPRSTVVRFAETLEELGYVERRRMDGRFSVAPKALSLSVGVRNLGRIAFVARPILSSLCKKIHWPLTIATLHENCLVPLDTTDAETQYKLLSSFPGADLPIRRSASGLVQLAFSSDEERQLLLQATKDDYFATGINDENLEIILRKIRADGYYFLPNSFIPNDPDHARREGIIAVPVIREDALLAILAARVIRAAVSTETIQQDLVPQLQTAARKIALGMKPDLDNGHGLPA